MTEVTKNEGLVYVLLERFEKYRLPRALEMQKKVHCGEVLSDFDLDQLNEVMKDSEEVKKLIDERPDLQDLYTRAVNLYLEITKKALENEQAAKGAPGS